MNRVRIYCCAALVASACRPAVAAEVRREIEFPDLAGYQTIACDLHMHTVFSDGLVWPTVRVAEAWRQGLDAMAITDHIEYQPHKDDVSTRHNRPYELVVEAAQVSRPVAGEGRRKSPATRRRATSMRSS